MITSQKLANSFNRVDSTVALPPPTVTDPVDTQLPDMPDSQAVEPTTPTEPAATKTAKAIAAGGFKQPGVYRNDGTGGPPDSINTEVPVVTTKVLGRLKSASNVGLSVYMRTRPSSKQILRNALRGLKSK